VRLLTKAVAVVAVLGLMIFFGARQLLTQETKQAVSLESAAGQDTVQQETYVSEVIISAPWGEKNLVYGGEESPPGQFGCAIDNERFLGPSCFAVAPNEDIYIADQFNRRIQRFDSQGGLVCTIPVSRVIADICIDDENYIYLCGGDSTSSGFLLKYDQQGNLIRKYALLTSSSTGELIYCDGSGQLFVTSQGAKPYEAGTATEAYSPEQQRQSEIDGFLGINSVLLSRRCFFQAASLPGGQLRALSIVTSSGDTLNTLHFPPLRGSVFGFDAQLNIYTTYSEETAYRVNKYDPNGQLISSFDYWCEKPYHHVYDFGGVRTMYLDDDGSLYMLCYSEGKHGGVRVVKWHRKK
jgi:hypothetical protein